MHGLLSSPLTCQQAQVLHCNHQLAGNAPPLPLLGHCHVTQVGTFLQAEDKTNNRVLTAGCVHADAKNQVLHMWHMLQAGAC